jgi:hypothetical protein
LTISSSFHFMHTATHEKFGEGKKKGEGEGRKKQLNFAWQSKVPMDSRTLFLSA